MKASPLLLPAVDSCSRPSPIPTARRYPRPSPSSSASSGRNPRRARRRTRARSSPSHTSGRTPFCPPGELYPLRPHREPGSDCPAEKGSRGNCTRCGRTHQRRGCTIFARDTGSFERHAVAPHGSIPAPTPGTKRVPVRTRNPHAQLAPRMTCKKARKSEGPPAPAATDRIDRSSVWPSLREVPHGADRPGEEVR